MALRKATPITVKPVSTVVQNIPVRALRSISGRVLLKVPVPAAAAGEEVRAQNNAGFELNPLAGGADQVPAMAQLERMKMVHSC